MDRSANCVLSLTVEAVSLEDGRTRLHVQRTDHPVDYGYLSPAELHYLIEALLPPGASVTSIATGPGPVPPRSPGHEVSFYRNQSERPA